jgi:hypothetical protein
LHTDICRESKELHLTGCLLVLMQPEVLFGDIYYLTILVNLNVWVNLVEILVCHTIVVLPERASPALIVYTTTQCLYTSLLIFLTKLKRHCTKHATDILCVYTHHHLMVTYPECKQQTFNSSRYANWFVRKIIIILHSCSTTILIPLIVYVT